MDRFEVVEQCGLKFEWIGMQQKGRMQAAIRVTSVENCAGATEHLTAIMPSPRRRTLLRQGALLQKTETRLPAKSVQPALHSMFKRLEELKANIASLEREMTSCRSSISIRGVDQEQSKHELHAALTSQCESLTRVVAALHHRQQQQVAHSITSSMTLSTTNAPKTVTEEIQNCTEGDALMAKGDFAAAAVVFGQMVAGVTSPVAREALKHRQTEALRKAKAQKKKRKKQRQNQVTSKQQQPPQPQQQQSFTAVPRPRRCLPDSLAKGNCRFDVRVTAAMAQALAQELLEISGIEQTAARSSEEKGCSDEAVRVSLESYKITEQMKRMQLRSVACLQRTHTHTRFSCVISCTLTAQ